MVGEGGGGATLTKALIHFFIRNIGQKLRKITTNQTTTKKGFVQHEKATD